MGHTEHSKFLVLSYAFCTEINHRKNVSCKRKCDELNIKGFSILAEILWAELGIKSLFGVCWDPMSESRMKECAVLAEDPLAELTSLSAFCRRILGIKKCSVFVADFSPTDHQNVVGAWWNPNDERNLVFSVIDPWMHGQGCESPIAWCLLVILKSIKTAVSAGCIFRIHAPYL